jgi:hypothetical protein
MILLDVNKSKCCKVKPGLSTVNSYFTRKSLDRLNNNLVSFKTQESIKHFFFYGSHPPETQKHLKLLSSLLLQDAAVIE